MNRITKRMILIIIIIIIRWSGIRTPDTKNYLNSKFNEIALILKWDASSPTYSYIVNGNIEYRREAKRAGKRTRVEEIKLSELNWESRRRRTLFTCGPSGACRQHYYHYYSFLFIYTHVVLNEMCSARTRDRQNKINNSTKKCVWKRDRSERRKNCVEKNEKLTTHHQMLFFLVFVWLFAPNSNSEKMITIAKHAFSKASNRLNVHFPFPFFARPKRKFPFWTGGRQKFEAFRMQPFDVKKRTTKEIHFVFFTRHFSSVMALRFLFTRRRSHSSLVNILLPLLNKTKKK